METNLIPCPDCGKMVSYRAKFCPHCGCPEEAIKEWSVVFRQTNDSDGCYIDLGLPSGTKWNGKNEDGFYEYDEAVSKFRKKLPTKKQLEELKDKCNWIWDANKIGYMVVGPNGNSIFLPAAGGRFCHGNVLRVGSLGYYWSSTPSGSEDAWSLYFNSGGVYLSGYDRCYGLSVRLVQD